MSTRTRTPATAAHDHPAPTAGTVVRAFYVALLADDLAAASGLLVPDATLRVPGSHPLAGDYQGLEAIVGFVLASTELIGAGSEQVELIDVLAGSDYAAAYCSVTGSRPGHADLHNLTLHLFRVQEGRIAEGWFHNWHQPSVDAFWS